MTKPHWIPVLELEMDSSLDSRLEFQQLVDLIPVWIPVWNGHWIPVWIPDWNSIAKEFQHCIPSLDLPPPLTLELDQHV